MSEHTGTQAHPSTKLFVWVWIWLVAITGVEVLLAYVHIQPASLMLAMLLGMSVVKAALIMSYFMHLRYERLSLVLLLIPALIFCICMMAVFFPDAARLLQMRP
jgi:caa(3)-type oxidase subunit IV